MVIFSKNKKEDLKISYNCCDNPNIQLYKGNYVCINCGIVHNQQVYSISQGYLDGKPIITQQTEIVHLGGSRTIILKSDKNIPQNEKRKYNRLVKIQQSIGNGFEKNLSIAYSRLKSFIAVLELPKFITNESFNIYKRFVNRKSLVGKIMNHFILASIYLAIRINRLPRTINEISRKTLITQNEIIKAYQIIAITLKIPLPLTPIVNYICRFGNDLDFPPIIQIKAKKLLEKIKENGFQIMGKNPKGLAGILLYITIKKTKGKITQKVISKICDVSEPTIRNGIKEVKKYLPP